MSGTFVQLIAAMFLPIVTEPLESYAQVPCGHARFCQFAPTE